MAAVDKNKRSIEQDDFTEWEVLLSALQLFCISPA